MQTSDTDTIAALATPVGRGGVGIVRVSGSHCRHIAEGILKQSLIPRRAYFKPFYDEKGEMIDQGLALFFQKPHSFTGEDVLELQGHGGSVVMDMLLSAILAQGARLAEPGEFSKRAFLNGKMDLTQAEAVADLIDATTRQAARSANRSLQGLFSQHIDQIANQLLELRIYVEAAIDFPDEEIDFLEQGQVGQKIQAIIGELGSLHVQAKQGRLLKEGMMVVIVGQPNAGKSSLLNALTQEETAIVTPIPGTTRDLIKETIQIDGLPVHIIDTAGIRQDADIVEQQGIARAKQQLSLADRILLVADCTQKTTIIEQEIIHAYQDKVTWVMNKIDLIDQASPRIEENKIFLSAKRRDGLSLLTDHLKHCVGYQSEVGNFIARSRHLEALAHAQQYCMKALTQLTEFKASELVAEELKMAHDALGEIVGKVTSDAMLGNIFSNFCIGK